MKRAALTIENRHCLAVHVAQSFFEKSRGLSNQKQWDGIPLVFLFKRPCRPAFWMHRVSFPLDLIWVSNGKIVGITENLPPARSKNFLYNMLFLKRHHPPRPVDMVIEMKPGEIRQLEIKPGHSAKITTPKKMAIDCMA